MQHHIKTRNAISFINFTAMATVIVSVISDLVTDQRVHKAAQTIHEMGFDVLLVGTEKKKSLPFAARDYKTKRIKMLFQKGFLFYAEWNTRLFFFLLFRSGKILLANDLDTLPANYAVAKLKKRILVYDTHEYFTETAELYNRSFVKKVWQRIENFLFPRVKYIYTVNNSIAALYKQKFQKELVVVRNVPFRRALQPVTDEFNLPANKKIVLMQGSGLNENRGLEELVLSMPLLPDEFILVIAGSGLIIDKLKNMAAVNNLNHRVFFTGLLQPEQLQQLTRQAFCGCSLDKPLNLNQQASLPNKLFDYIAAGVPVIAGNIAEVAAIIHQYKIGKVINEVSPESIATAVTAMAKDENQYLQFKQNTVAAYNELNWDNEKQILISLFKKVAEENHTSIG
jgi:glycosyltransferase involved in cell wall biosynthesis